MKLLGVILFSVLAWFTARAELDSTFVEEHRGRLERLMRNLDFSHPGLELTASHWQAGKLKAACETLLDYFDQKSWPQPLIEEFREEATFSDNKQRSADDALAGYFTLQGVRGKQEERDDGGLDWEARGPRDDQEWAWMLNRHAFFTDLLSAWQHTGDDRYRVVLDEYLRDWILNSPYPDRVTFSAQWRPLEVARRIQRAWPVVFVLGGTSDETRLLMLDSIFDHADSLREHPSPWGNHLLTETTMLAKLATLWPEFADADEWLDYASERVTGLIEKQVYPDGAYKELSNHYQIIAMRSFQKFYQLMRLAEREVKIEVFRDRLIKMWHYYWVVQKPDGTGPLNNDSDLEDNANDVIKRFENDTPKVPEGSSYFPWAGHAVMRDGHNNDARWAFFDMGPYGTQHEHEDRLHLSLSVGRQNFLVDAGRYTYKPGPARDYFRGPHSHNIVLLNGRGTLPPAREVSSPLPSFVSINDDIDCFKATASYANGWHTRAVLFFHGVGWVVLDEVIAFGPNEVATLWHWHPDVAVTVSNNQIQADGPDKSLYVRPVVLFGYDLNKLKMTQVKGLETPRFAGWYGPKFNKREAAWQVECTIRINRPVITAWLIADSLEAIRVLETHLQSMEIKPPLKDLDLPLPR